MTSQPPLASASRWPSATDRVAVVSTATPSRSPRSWSRRSTRSCRAVTCSSRAAWTKARDRANDRRAWLPDRAHGRRRRHVRADGVVDRCGSRRAGNRCHASACSSSAPATRGMGARRESPRGRGVVADLARLRREGGSRLLRLVEVEDMLTPFAGMGADAIAIEHHETKRRCSRSRAAPAHREWPGDCTAWRSSACRCRSTWSSR